jgi:hypothetical protein
MLKAVVEDAAHRIDEENQRQYRCGGDEEIGVITSQFGVLAGMLRPGRPWGSYD